MHYGKNIMATEVPSFAGQGIELRMVETLDHGSGMRRGIAQPVEMKFPAEDADGEIIPPMLHLDRDAAKQLMDELWKCGIRPSNGEGSTGQLAATEKHLADMKAIAFNRLKMGVTS